MEKYNISTNLIQVIKNLYNKATTAVLVNGTIGDCFRTTVGVRQGCLLSPTLFNIFLERIMADATPVASTEIKVNGQKLETVTSFKYLGSVITDEGSKPEILSSNSSIDKAETSLD